MVTTDANIDSTGMRNLTISGELDAATLDISGNADIDGTLETDALSIASTTVTATAAELNFTDGGSTIGTTAVADGDGIIHNDGGTMKVTSAATFKTYFQEGISQAYDDFTIGDAAVTISTSSGDITVDAAANDSDIIFKGTDGGADTTFLTIDGSDGGTLIANHNLELGTDSSQILFGADNEITLTHVADAGLTLKHTATADDKPITFTLATGETDIAANDVLGEIHFQAPDEATGTDAILVAASVAAISEGDFSSSNNATKLSFKTAASESATEKMSLSSAGHLTVAGRIITDNATEATSTTDGSLQTDGGLSVVKDIVAGDDIKLLSDDAVVHFGADSDVTITHDPDDGLFLKSTATAASNPFILTLQTGETDIAADDVLGTINFQAPDEGTGTDAILVAAGIRARSEGNFSSSNNATSLELMTGASETATAKVTISSAGNVGIGKTTPTSLADFAGPGLTIKSDAPFIGFEDANNSNKSVYIGNQGGIFSIGEMDDDFSSNKTEHMRISNTGQVSIGTTSSTHHLFVDANGQTTDSWIRNGNTVQCSGSWNGSKEVRVDWSITSSVSYILEFIVASYGAREHFVVGSYYAGNSHQTVMTQNGSDSMTQGGNSGGERWQSSGGTHGVYCVRLTSAQGLDDALVTLI